MASKRRGGFRPPELRGTLGTLIRTTTGVFRDALERGAREGRARFDDARANRRRNDALADLGDIVLDLIRRGEIDLAELPEARDLIRELDEIDQHEDDHAAAHGHAHPHAHEHDHDHPHGHDHDHDHPHPHAHDDDRDLPRLAERHRFEDLPTRRDTPRGINDRPTRPDSPRRIDDRPTQLDERPRRSDDRPIQLDERPRRSDDRPTQLDERPRRPDDRPTQPDERPRRATDRHFPAPAASTRPTSDDRLRRPSPSDTYDDGTVSSGAAPRSHRPTDPRSPDDPARRPAADRPRRPTPSDTHEDPAAASSAAAAAAAAAMADRAAKPTTPERPDNRPSTSTRAPTRPIPRDPARKGGISFDDDDDLADYMHPDDVPPKTPPKDPDDHSA